MERIEYKTIDKSGWTQGPWTNEPDKIQFQDPATRYPCLIVRAHSGALCGYVGIDKTHPAYGINYDGLTMENHKAIMDNFMKIAAERKEAGESIDYYIERKVVAGIGEAIGNIEVHGGLTFAGLCSKGPEETSICHKSEDGKDIFWFGFDCSHFGDISPGMDAALSKLGGPYLRLSDHASYKDIDYVTAEIESLAKQLKALEAN